MSHPWRNFDFDKGRWDAISLFVSGETNFATWLFMLEIATDRLTLKPLQVSDAERLAALADNYEIARMVATVPHPYGIDDAHQFIVLSQKALERQRSLPLGIFHEDGNLLIGTVGVKVCEDTATGDLGYWIGQPYWGKGFATEAVNGLLEFAFRERGIAKIRAMVAFDNPVSKRVLEKCGLQYTGEECLHRSEGRGEDVPCGLFEIDFRKFIEQSGR